MTLLNLYLQLNWVLDFFLCKVFNKLSTKTRTLKQHFTTALSSDDISVKIKGKETTRSFRSKEILISAPMNKHKSRLSAFFHCLFSPLLQVEVKETKTSEEKLSLFNFLVCVLPKLIHGNVVCVKRWKSQLRN